MTRENFLAQLNKVGVPSIAILTLAAILFLAFIVFQGTLLFNKYKWETRSSPDYKISVLVNSFGPLRGNTQIVVRQRKIVSLDNSKTWCPSCDRKDFETLTAEGLFDIVDPECGFGVFLFAYCQIDYDAVYGYPKLINKHCITLATDCDYSIEVDKLEFE